MDFRLKVKYLERGKLFSHIDAIVRKKLRWQKILNCRILKVSHIWDYVVNRGKCNVSNRNKSILNIGNNNCHFENKKEFEEVKNIVLALI